MKAELFYVYGGLCISVQDEVQSINSNFVFHFECIYVCFGFKYTESIFVHTHRFQLISMMSKDKLFFFPLAHSSSCLLSICAEKKVFTFFPL